MPFLNPGMVNEQPQRKSMMMKRSGIISLEKRSMPFLTPAVITTWVKAMKSTRQTIGFHGFDTNAPKLSAKTLPSAVAAWDDIETKLPAAASPR